MNLPSDTSAITISFAFNLSNTVNNGMTAIAITSTTDSTPDFFQFSFTKGGQNIFPAFLIADTYVTLSRI
jgi:hypothetical protein